MKDREIIPPYLTTGDKVAVVSPSGVVDKERVHRGIGIIESWGLEVVTGRHYLASQGSFAGTDAQRLGDIQEALDDPSVKAIICSRGGYGLSRIIDKIDFTRFLVSPKWIAGFSDITVLHTWIGSLYGISTVHCEMPLNYGGKSNDKESASSVRSLLFGEPAHYEWEGAVINPAPVSGVLTGGNLALLYSLAGTVGRPETAGKVLFIEDTGEHYYSVDRMLSSLRLAGMLDSLAALLVGSFTDMIDERIPYGSDVKEIITGIAGGFGYPLFFDFPAGHSPRNLAFYLGRSVRLTAGGLSSTLQYL